ncbi:MAG: DNA polymerase III subunit delta [Arenimonas sp.]
MKIDARRADAFVAVPPDGLRVALVYGPDLGLVRERADKLARAVVPDPSDAFRMADLAADQVVRDPARLADEAAAIAFGGGRRVVRVRDAADALAAAVENLLAQPAADALVVIEAGELAPRSALRLLLEKATDGAALPCYHDEGDRLGRTIDAALAEHGLAADAPAREELMLSLGGDRLATKAEIAKLATYVGAARSVTLADVEAVVGDVVEATLDDVAFAATLGDQPRLERALGRAFGQGEDEVALLRAVARHVGLLHRLAIRTDTSGSREAAMSELLRPPIHFRVRDAAIAASPRWSTARLGRALERLLEAEVAVKTTGNPQRTIVRQVLLELAADAASAGPRRARH